MKDLFLMNATLGDGEDDEVSYLVNAKRLFSVIRQFQSLKTDYAVTIWHVNGFSEELTRMSLVPRGGKMVIVGGGLRFDEE